ncbi:conserved hypothetical protein [Chlamydia pneumoniae LPCoLN]|uniref:Uncharacterized protein n=1 Tax=Chlamydia pneumoniae TaxID=83558 RepID=Q9Z7V3_CHLPN|nr:hypothetical protein [Chlamydia pneumoniae]AAD18740.1 CT483 hypothetical protein [Chlamydia pneumoniae CWL029]AAF38028.1 conserved hypothetical protein [Chlamydia pneumoniae AR39]ACZ33578.1 conserved hypothetical protein [Chlamydia pneumoniae LPCoLN]CRI33117.1 Uncharacterized protein BN1224_Wien1_A_06240 [Chlamydia pneumoniae]CRI35980.1 Uncharacterized protein BN1224_CM1_A_06270 [Chlamydia pneumoniae]
MDEITPNYPLLRQDSLWNRVRVSWRADLSVSSRYEIASAIAILGLLVAFCASAAVSIIFTANPLAQVFIDGCLALGLLPIPLVIGLLIIGIIVLLYGIYLFPQQRE